jgi:predicted nucleic acid-binding protein
LRKSAVGSGQSARREDERNGRSLPVIDALIAATAITKELTVVTRHTDDIKESGVALLDPWKSPYE